MPYLLMRGIELHDKRSPLDKGGLRLGNATLSHNMKRVLELSLVALLIIAACGGSTGLTKTEYIAQANAICDIVNAESDRVSDEIFGELGEEPTVEEAGGALQLSLNLSTPVFEAGLADLRALAAPDGDSQLLTSLFDDLEAAREAVRGLAAEYAAGNAAIEELLNGPDQPFVSVNQGFLEYGLTECG